MGTDEEREEVKQKELAAAPYTVIHGDKELELKLERMAFQPTMGEMKGLSLPDNLPLGGIADYKFQADTSTIPSIAPSMFQNSGLPDLPQIAAFSTGPTALQPHQNVLQLGPVDASPPPPPPPLSLDFQSQDKGWSH